MSLSSVVIQKHRIADTETRRESLIDVYIKKYIVYHYERSL